MIDPYVALLLLVGGICLLPVIYSMKLNLYRRGEYSNASFQAGMIMATIVNMIGLGLITLFIWSIT